MGFCKCGTELLTKCRRCRECSKVDMARRRKDMVDRGFTSKDVHNYNWRYNNPERYMLHTAKSRAKSKGWDFNLEVSDIIIPEVCPVFGTSFTLEIKKGMNPRSPSLDRIDSKLGYVKGNVQVISWRANNLKSDGTPEEFKQLLEFMYAEKRSV